MPPRSRVQAILASMQRAAAAGLDVMDGVRRECPWATGADLDEAAAALERSAAQDRREVAIFKEIEALVRPIWDVSPGTSVGDALRLMHERGNRRAGELLALIRGGFGEKAPAVNDNAA